MAGPIQAIGENDEPLTLDDLEIGLPVEVEVTVVNLLNGRALPAGLCVLRPTVAGRAAGTSRLTVVREPGAS